MEIILCSFTNGSNNGGTFETAWICPNCKDFTILKSDDNFVSCNNGSACFQFHYGHIKGLDSHYTHYGGDYGDFNETIGDIKNGDDYYEYLLQNSIIRKIDEKLYEENKTYIDNIKPPFGFDYISVFACEKWGFGIGFTG